MGNVKPLCSIHLGSTSSASLSPPPPLSPSPSPITSTDQSLKLINIISCIIKYLQWQSGMGLHSCGGAKLM